MFTGSLVYKWLEAVHNKHPQSGGVVQCEHFADKRGGGFSDVDVQFWCEKLRIF